MTQLALAYAAVIFAALAIAAGAIALVSAALVSRAGHLATRRQVEAWERRARFERGSSFRETRT